MPNLILPKIRHYLTLGGIDLCTLCLKTWMNGLKKILI